MNALKEYIKGIKFDKKTLYVLFAGVIGIVLIFFSEVDLNKKEERKNPFLFLFCRQCRQPKIRHRAIV